MIRRSAAFSFVLACIFVFASSCAVENITPDAQNTVDEPFDDFERDKPSGNTNRTVDEPFDDFERD